MDIRIAQSDSELGYLRGEEPSDAQLALQDSIDNTVQSFLQEISNIYAIADRKEPVEVEWDIGKITEVRETVEEQLSLPTNIY